MKLIIIQTIVALLLINIVFAVSSSEESGSSAVGVSQPIKGRVPPDLSNFPDMFIKNGVFDAVIVVGDKAPASDVIAQSNLVQFFVGYTGKSLVGSTQLSSEIESLNQNIISIGSAYHNNVSWEIMVQPKQCDRWLEPGKAMILLYGYKDYVYMVIAGYSDKGTRDAVDVLINYDKRKLGGSNMLVDVDEPKPEINNSRTEEKTVEDNITIDFEKEKEKIISELNERISKSSQDSNKKVISPAISSQINKTKGKITSEQKQAIKVEQKGETSIIKRIINWFILLFK